MPFSTAEILIPKEKWRVFWSIYAAVSSVIIWLAPTIIFGHWLNRLSISQDAFYFTIFTFWLVGVVITIALIRISQHSLWILPRIMVTLISDIILLPLAHMLNLFSTTFWEFFIFALLFLIRVLLCVNLYLSPRSLRQ